MDIRLYDTMTRSKRVFEPADPQRVTMYVCGPTVYGRAHIGNARPAVVFDVLARLLRHKYGAEHVIYARNITDIDDKINASAAAQGVDIGVVAARYEQHYLADMAALGVLPPDIAPHATAHIPQMIAMIGALIGKGAAYMAQGHVLFDVTAPGDYGALSRRPLDAMIAGARVEVAPYKQNPADFVLWKPSAPDQPGWESPWGRGRPGWHIECSAMIAAHLGETIDIHGGGLDLIFPHHENELAQSSCAHGAPLARYWLHNGFLSMGDTKMSKSLGNVVSVGDLLAQGWDGEVLRLALLSAHYRQPLAWTEELLAQSKAKLDTIYGHMRRGYGDWLKARDRLGKEPEADLPLDFLLAIDDDLNTPEAIGQLTPLVLELARAIAKRPIGEDVDEFAALVVGEKLQQLRRAGEVLGILQSNPDEWFTSGTSTDSVDGQIAARTAARARRDFAESDRIRDELAAAGIVLEDGPGGTTWRRA